MKEHWKITINIAIVCTSLFVITVVISIATVVAYCDRKVIRNQGVVQSIERTCK